MDENKGYKSDLFQLSRLALNGQQEDIRLFVARLVRKYRKLDIDYAKQLESFLHDDPTSTRSPLRKKSLQQGYSGSLPVDNESRLSLLRKTQDKDFHIEPILKESLKKKIVQLIQERKQLSKLQSIGLKPTKSAIFVGPPGVGKTLTARWLAAQLELPFYILDLTAVMSSFLGKSGSNLRAALETQ